MEPNVGERDRLFRTIFGIFGMLLGFLFIQGGIGLVVSGALVLFGALMLTLDFDRAEMIVEGGADRAYEWTVAVGLMVTIIWIYVELLRFLAILNSRRN